MARLIVGIARSEVTNARVPPDLDRGFTLDITGGRTIELEPQNLESEGIAWYWADVDDNDSDGLIEALSATPGVASSYVQPPDAAP